jgi:polyhydroxyalkanoate synthesis regulator phasin
MKKQKKKITIDDLAMMTKRGFDELGEKLGEKIDELGERVKEGFGVVSENNAREHDDIKLRLDNVAYRFELVELQKRVDALEKKTGIKK